MIVASQASEIRTRPMYTIADAARHLRLNAATLRAWVKGAGRQAPVISLDGDGEYLSFFNLVEAHVLSSVRRDHHLSLQRIRAALEYVKLGLQVPRPLIDERFSTDGVDLFVDHLGLLLNCSRRGQQAMKPVMALYLRQIEWDDHGLPVRLYPMSRLAPKRAQSLIVVSPNLAFGRPVIKGSGVPVEELVSRHRAGDSVRDLEDAFGLSRHVITEALHHAA
jgi:uncharacterized protein (DUF433 family)